MTAAFFIDGGKGPELAVIILLMNNSRTSPVLNVTGLLPSTGRGGDPALKNTGAGILHTTFTYFDHYPFHSRIPGRCSHVMAQMVGKLAFIVRVRSGMCVIKEHQVRTIISASNR